MLSPINSSAPKSLYSQANPVHHVHHKSKPAANGWASPRGATEEPSTAVVGRSEARQAPWAMQGVAVAVLCVCALASSPVWAASPLLIPRPPQRPAVPTLGHIYQPWFIPVEQVIPPGTLPGKIPPFTEEERAELARRWLRWQSVRGAAAPSVAPSAPLNLSPVTNPNLQRWVR